MKKLEEEFMESKFKLKQIKRQGNIAIFLRSKKSFFHYEVVRIKSHNGYNLNIKGINKEVIAKEYYPYCESWGVDGFTYPTLERAEEKFKELINGKN